MFIGWDFAALAFIAYMMARTTIKYDGIIEILAIFGLVIYLMGM